MNGCFRHRAHHVSSLLIGWWGAGGHQLHPSALLVSKTEGFFFLPLHKTPQKRLLLCRTATSLISDNHPLARSHPFFSFYPPSLSLSLALPSPPPPLTLPPSPHDPASNTGRHVTGAGSIRVHLLHVLYNESYITCLLTGCGSLRF